jgi:hypothetical protein
MTASGALTTYVTPGRNVPANEIASGPGNTLWFTMGVRGIGRVSTLAFTSGPRLSRRPQVGKVVSCLFGGLNATASTVAWLVNGTVRQGATGRDFTPTAADLGKALSCSVKLTNAGGSLTKRSAAVKVALGAALLPVKKPALSGPHRAGKAESVSSGTWTPGATSYGYQWYLGSSAIAHATADRYAPPAKDRGKSLHCVVTARRPGYASGNTLAAWGTMRRNPAPPMDSARHHRLRGSLATGLVKDGAPDRWQIEVTGAGRIWYLVDPENATVWVDYAGPGHPRATDS